MLAREQHLSQLDGLAAAAAHELGTPLATVALVVTELARQSRSRRPIAPTTFALPRSKSAALPDDFGQAVVARHDRRGPLEERRSAI